jgi:KDO transferase-3
MDLGHQGSQARFYKERRNARPSFLDRDYEDYILPSFEVLGHLCQAGELQVYNLSPSSRLPESIIPKLAFQEALEMTAGDRAA